MQKGDFTLTFYKKCGSGLADIFKGTFPQAGEKPSEWQLLTRDQDLKSVGVKMFVLEYVETKFLPDGYDLKVKSSPHLDLKSEDNNLTSLAYPYDGHLTAQAIKSWILTNIPKLNPMVKDVAAAVVASSGGKIVAPEIPVAAPVVNSSTGGSSGSTTTPDSTTQEKEVVDTAEYRENYIPYVIGGGLLFAVFAAAGVVIGGHMADAQAETPARLLLVDNDAEVHDVDDWTEKPPTAGKSTTVNQSAPPAQTSRAYEPIVDFSNIGKK